MFTDANATESNTEIASNAAASAYASMIPLLSHCSQVSKRIKRGRADRPTTAAGRMRLAVRREPFRNSLSACAGCRMEKGLVRAQFEFSNLPDPARPATRSSTQGVNL